MKWTTKPHIFFTNLALIVVREQKLMADLLSRMSMVYGWSRKQGFKELLNPLTPLLSVSSKKPLKKLSGTEIFPTTQLFQAILCRHLSTLTAHLKGCTRKPNRTEPAVRNVPISTALLNLAAQGNPKELRLNLPASIALSSPSPAPFNRVCRASSRVETL